MNTDCIYKFLRENLSEKRLRHIEGVKKTAGYLAEKYGENPEKAEIAALFHDMYRKLSDSEIDFYIKKSDWKNIVIRAIQILFTVKLPLLI